LHVLPGVGCGGVYCTAISCSPSEDSDHITSEPSGCTCKHHTADQKGVAAKITVSGVHSHDDCSLCKLLSSLSSSLVVEDCARLGQFQLGYQDDPCRAGEGIDEVTASIRGPPATATSSL
jgi:hypothetical protein